LTGIPKGRIRWELAKRKNYNYREFGRHTHYVGKVPTYWLFNRTPWQRKMITVCPSTWERLSEVGKQVFAVGYAGRVAPLVENSLRAWMYDYTISDIQMMLYGVYHVKLRMKTIIRWVTRLRHGHSISTDIHSHSYSQYSPALSQLLEPFTAAICRQAYKQANKQTNNKLRLDITHDHTPTLSPSPYSLTGTNPPGGSLNDG